MVPLAHRLVCNGIELCVREWPASGLVDAARARSAVLLHGYMDVGSTWDGVAPRLASAGFRVVAPDLRGHGDSGRVGAGGYYHFPDYVFDVADLVDRLVVDTRGTELFLVGHSMGGVVATLYAGTFPDRVTKLANLEGVGPPDNAFDVAPVRARRWISDVRKLRARGEERGMPRDEALARLASNHPNLDGAILSDRLAHLTRPLADGLVAWKHDPLHKTHAPSPFFARQFAAFAREIRCPTLFVDGGPLGYHPPDEEQRLAAFGDLEHVTLEGAGHMMHWTRPTELADTLARFWARSSATPNV